MGKNQHLWVLLVPLWIILQGFLFFILINTPDSFLFVSIISFVVYLIFILLFSTRFQHSPPWVNEYISQMQSTLQSYQPVTKQDILAGWWITQKRGLRGFLRRLPNLKSFISEDVERSILVEVESEAEYYQISDTERMLPYSQASNLVYFPKKGPFPVKYPRNFISTTQEFPLTSTLKKETCSRCSGSGTVSCSSCSGSGTVTCSRCSGWGYIERTEWDGDEHKTVRESCSCFNGSVTCSSCGGSGQVTCSMCKGEGNLGKYTARLYVFIHWKNVYVFKEKNGEVVGEAELKDLPNVDARLIEILDRDSFSGMNPEKLPKVSKNTISRLLSKKQEFQDMIDQLQNVLIYRHSFREFPEIKINIRKGQNEYTLIGRGFKPFQEQYAELEDYPISKLRLIALYIPYGIILTLAFLISFF
ncbi:MAG: zinc finger-like domain-containing protein [Promethearchaeota archaeon]